MNCNTVFVFIVVRNVVVSINKHNYTKSKSCCYGIIYFTSMAENYFHEHNLILHKNNTRQDYNEINFTDKVIFKYKGLAVLGESKTF